MWETLMLIGKGDKQKKDSKLTIATKKFEDFKIGATESIAEMETRFMKLLSEVADLGKEPTQKEINLNLAGGTMKC
nr:kinesin-related protein 4-like [Ipomoea batatas]